MRETAASLGEVEADIEEVGDELKGKADGSKLYMKSCPQCKGTISFIGNSVPRDCPHCGQMYWFKPRDERRLFILQYRFFESGRDPHLLGEMYLEMRRYAENLLKNRAKKGRPFSKNFLEEKSSDATNRLIERFLTNPDYKIHVSFGMMLNKSLGFIYSNKDRMIDQAVSFDQPFFENGSSMMDNMVRLGLGSPEVLITRSIRGEDENQRVAALVKKTLDAIHDTVRRQQGARNAILFLCGMRLQLFARRPAHASERFYSTFGSDTRRNIERAELIMREMVKEGALS